MSPATAQRLADRETAAGLASTLAWTGSGALLWLKRLDQTEDDPESAPVDRATALRHLSDYGRRLREIAAKLDTFCETEQGS